CGTCIIPPGYNGQQLGVGCADLYSASVNSVQNQAGPRSQVNALTGVFTFPVDYTGFPAAQPTIGRRVQVLNADVDPASNSGAQYFIESQYVTADDAAAANAGNNASYREAVVTSASTFAMATTGTTVRGLAAIHAWAADPLVTISSQTISGVGTITLGSRAESLGNGLWKYTYAVYNLDCDRAVGALSMQVSSCAVFSAPWSSLPRYHSGEVWSNQAWVFDASGGVVGWAVPEQFAQNPDSSAIRWSSAGSYEFIADRPPNWRSVAIDFFKPGSPTRMQIAAWIPGQNPDYDGDGSVDFFDYDVFVGDYESGAPGADFDGDGALDFFDYDAFVRAFEAGC
ncbi:MAG: GC-type dockerin domain-anchored protein, partial [Planctomycetota bacterium]